MFDIPDIKVLRVNGYEAYRISYNGLIFSDISNKLLKFDDSSDYLRVTLYIDSIPSRFSVHRLVAEHFVPNPENKPCVNHNDGNKRNNLYINLKWATDSENVIHAIENNLRSTKEGVAHYRSKFDENQVREMRERYIQGEKIYRLADEFQVDDSVMFNIINKKTYKNVI